MEEAGQWPTRIPIRRYRRSVTGSHLRNRLSCPSAGDRDHSGRRPISFPHPKCNLRIEQRCRLPHQICHLQKPTGQHSIIPGSAMEFCDVPVDEAYLSRALAFDTRVLKIATDGNLPRNIDELAGCPKETSSDFLRAGRQAFAQGQRFHAGNGHPLNRKPD